MTIQLKKFGTLLISRQSGKEALLGYSPMIKTAAKDEVITIDFEGVTTFSPSWGDEFLSQLFHQFGKKLVLKNTDNLSVKATIKILEETNEMKFKVE